MERTSCSLKKCFSGSATLRLSLVGLHVLEAEDAHIGRGVLRDLHDLEIVEARIGRLFRLDHAVGGVLAREEDEVGIAAVLRTQEQPFQDSRMPADEARLESILSFYQRDLAHALFQLDRGQHDIRSIHPCHPFVAGSDEPYRLA